MKIKRIVISVVCLLLAVMLAVGGYCGVIAVKSHYDTQMQEQYDAGYTTCNDEVKHKMNVLTAEIADLQKRLVNVSDPAVAALMENVGTALENGDDATVETLLTDYLANGGSQSVVEMVRAIISFEQTLQEEREEARGAVIGLYISAVIQSNEARREEVYAEYIANGGAQAEVDFVENIIKSNLETQNQIADLEKQVADLQKQIEELQNGGTTVACDLSAVTWNGFVPTLGQNIWTDGVDYYYSDKDSNGAYKHYVLDVATQTWSPMVWNGTTSFTNSGIWTDGTNYYYRGTYVLDVATHTWVAKSFDYGNAQVHWEELWTDGEKIYSSYAYYHYVIDPVTRTCSSISFNAGFNGSNVWTDGTRYYVTTNGNTRLIDTTTYTLTAVTWNGDFVPTSGKNIWTDGTNTYYSDGLEQYVLDIATQSWVKKSWNPVLNISAANVWRMGDNVYFSNLAEQYVFNKAVA